MPIYASPDEFKNGYAPAGSVVPQPETLPEGVNPKPPEEQPSVWGAAFRKNNMLAGLYLKPPQFEPVEGYNPYADKSELEGYDLRATAFAESRSPQETAWIKQQIDEEDQDSRVVAEAGCSAPKEMKNKPAKNEKSIKLSIYAVLLGPVTWVGIPR